MWLECFCVFTLATMDTLAFPTGVHSDKSKNFRLVDEIKEIIYHHVYPQPKVPTKYILFATTNFDDDNCVHSCDEDGLESVCGTDGRTYTNVCWMQEYSCLWGINVTKVKDGPCEEDCLNDCSRADNLVVCGTDGVTYPTGCHLKRQECLNKTPIQIKWIQNCALDRSGLCPKGEECVQDETVKRQVLVSQSISITSSASPNTSRKSSASTAIPSTTSRSSKSTTPTTSTSTASPTVAATTAANVSTTENTSTTASSRTASSTMEHSTITSVTMTSSRRPTAKDQTTSTTTSEVSTASSTTKSSITSASTTTGGTSSTPSTKPTSKPVFILGSNPSLVSVTDSGGTSIILEDNVLDDDAENILDEEVIPSTEIGTTSVVTGSDVEDVTADVTTDFQDELTESPMFEDERTEEDVHENKLSKYSEPILSQIPHVLLAETTTTIDGLTDLTIEVITNITEAETTESIVDNAFETSTQYNFDVEDPSLTEARPAADEEEEPRSGPDPYSVNRLFVEMSNAIIGNIDDREANTDDVNNSTEFFFWTFSEDDDGDGNTDD